MNGAQISLLTAGRDKHYALGLATALAAAGVKMDLIGSDGLDSAELRGNPQIKFFNLRGDQSIDAGLLQKMTRVLIYYLRLIFYAARAKPEIFHLLWNNKFETFDRTALMLYYKLLGKKIVFTAHNVNAAERDAQDSWLNRMTLKFQYRWCDHILVHTEKMKDELIVGFDVSANRVSVIPYGINNMVPNSGMTVLEARKKLGLNGRDKALLFFGNIAAYKGLEFLVEAFEIVAKSDKDLRLIIAGMPKGAEDYWRGLLERIHRSAARDKMILKIEYVPDAETEIYFKAADVLVLPYTRIFQSGVLFLGYSFGLPALAADVGSLKQEIIEGRTGFVFPAANPTELARTILDYFESDLYRQLNFRRKEILDFANDRHSWGKVAAITTAVYSKLSRAQKQDCPHCAVEKA
jgi:D-inositol-3-phosphate glycosyltransferase